MSLPLPWVDKIFLKLTLLYGREFAGRWEGLEIADVKTDWGHELAGFENWPDAIAYALANCPPGKPPTVIEFRQIAHKTPRSKYQELPPPPANKEFVASVLAKVNPAVREKPFSYDHKSWAKAIIAREKAGEILNPTTKRFAYEALA